MNSKDRLLIIRPKPLYQPRKVTYGKRQTVIEKKKIIRPPAVYSNESHEERIERYMRMVVPGKNHH